jgi:peptidoglycan hydrolase CwlO-like protein
MKKRIISFFLVLLLFAVFITPFSITAEEDPSPTPEPTVADSSDKDDELSELQEEINKYQRILSETIEKKNTLKSQISYMDSQIELTNLKIDQTQNRIQLLEAQIKSLNEKIGILDISLDEVSALFINRVVASYKSSMFQPIELIFAADSFSDFFRKVRYLHAAQMNDRETLLTMEQIRSDYDQQKTKKEEKQQELQAMQQQLADQKAQLDAQKKSKEYLLEVTKNDEEKYQQLLAQAKAEYEAIQAVLAGQGDETEIGEVSQGDVIATIINAASCNSSGPHLHFTVKNNGSSVNPFNYLQSGVSYENCSGYGCGSGGDPFNPSGSWPWPIDTPVRFTQGYGSTWAVQHQSWLPYSFHNGIDIYNSSLNVKAVQDGTLYRGSYSGIGSCKLRYVRVDHAGSEMSTYYLHIN